jgi:putative ABC transport system permease protein
MRDVFYLIWRYLAYNRFKSAVLVLSVTLILFLPIGLKTLVGQSARSLTARADATPLIVGAKGSPLELVLNSLYFESDGPEQITFSEVARVQQTGLADAIPLYTRFSARGYTVVGTTLDYFDFRNLHLASGRKMAVLGDCVVGASVARSLNIGIGESVITSPESVFDLAGTYPLKLKIVGVLAPSGTPDDRVILVDIKSSWIIQGLAHGHQDMAKPEAAGAVLKREGNVVIANASVMQYNEITVDNIDSFHFHGALSGFPISSVIAVPHSEKASTLLQGKYLDEEEHMQIVNPAGVMDELLKTILTVQNYMIAGVLVVALSTCLTGILVFVLSIRLRQREIETMHRIGGNRLSVIGLLGLEILVVLIAGMILAAALTAIASQFGEQLIRLLIA